MVTVGAEVYPEPGFVNVTWIILPWETLAFAVAPLPPPPVSVTCGVVYPEPPFTTMKLIPVGLGEGDGDWVGVAVGVDVGVGVGVGVAVVVGGSEGCVVVVLLRRCSWLRCCLFPIWFRMGLRSRLCMC